MKNIYFYFLISSLVVYATSSPAQDLPWLETGSEWTYQHGVFSGPEHFQVTYGITEQTTFAGQPCAKMERISTLGLGCMALEAPYYFYVSNDSLYYATDELDNFRLAAYFGAEPGDSWEYITGYGENTTSFTVTVNSVSLIDVEEFSLRRLNVTYEFDFEGGEIIYDDIYPETMEITEVVGAEYMFFIPMGHGSACDYETDVTLQCFESPSFSYLNPTYPSCEYVVGIEESSTNISLAVYPNPSTDFFTLELPANQTDDVRVQMYNSTGKLVYEQSGYYETSLTIDASNFKKGIYFLTLHNGKDFGTATLVVD